MTERTKKDELVALAEEIMETEHTPTVQAFQKAATLLSEYMKYAKEWDIGAYIQKLAHLQRQV